MILKRLRRLLRPQRWWLYPLYVPVVYVVAWCVILEWGVEIWKREIWQKRLK